MGSFLAPAVASFAFPALLVAGVLSLAASEAQRTPRLKPIGSEALPFSPTARFALGAEVTGRPAYGPDGGVYVGAQNGFLYALDATLRLQWKRDLGAPIYGGVLLTPEGTLYVGTEGKVLWSFDRRGNLLRKTTLDAPIETTPAWSNRGHIIVTVGREVVALGPDGAIVFRARAWGKFLSNPIVDDEGGVYAGSQDGNFYAFGADGVERFRVHPGPAIDSDAVLGPEGSSFFADTQGRVHAIDEWGEIRWAVALGSAVRAPLARGPNDTLLALTQGPRVCLFVLAMESGHILAKHVIALTDSEDSRVPSGPTVDAGGRVWFGGPSDKLWLLATLRGPARSLALPAPLSARPWIGESGNLLMTESTGELVLGRVGVIPSLLPGAKSL